MSETLRQVRGALPMLIVLAIVLTFVVFFLRQSGVFSETVTLPADQLGLAPAPTATSDSGTSAGRRSAGSTTGTATPVPVEEVTLEIVTLLPKDAIPAIFDPEFVTASEADSFFEDDDLVMGVEINGEARAYGTAFLSSHEIVNDTVGGRPIAVTW
jgi:uncharacterized protein DUF3179